MSHTVLIAGGGIGGLAAAIACARGGQTVQLFERAAAFAEIGAGIQLGSNVTRILHGWGLQQAVEAVAAYPDRLQARDAVSGTTLGTLRLGDTALQRYGAPYATVHRADLHSLLAREVAAQTNVMVHLDTGIDRYEPQGTRVSAITVRGQQHEGDLLVGADGLHSRIRHQLLNDGQPRASAHRAYRALVEQSCLPERLPDLPKVANEMPALEQTAMSQRMDVQAAKLSSEQLAKNLGLTKATRFINVLDVGAERKSATDLPVQRGYTISLELPIFDWGTARVARAEAIYMQSVNRTAETAINARSEVRQAYQSYRSSFEIARHYRDEIVPLKKRISEENQLRYNGMLIGVFELLADARSQIGSVQGYIAALRDFWIAQADLDMALIGKPSMSTAPSAAMASGQVEP